MLTALAKHASVLSTTTPLKAITHLHPGDCISSDQLESNALGKFAILMGVHSKMNTMPAPS
jgi:hypothetical protein